MPLELTHPREKLHYKKVSQKTKLMKQVTNSSVSKLFWELVPHVTLHGDDGQKDFNANMPPSSVTCYLSQNIYDTRGKHFHLCTNGHIDSASERCANCTGWETQAREKCGECCGKVDSRSLLSHNDTVSNASKVHSFGLKESKQEYHFKRWQNFRHPSSRALEIWRRLKATYNCVDGYYKLVLNAAPEGLIEFFSI